MAADGEVSDTAAWQQAEERVAAVYRSLGFLVTRDVTILGNQIDIVADQRSPGIGPLRVCIEVKHRSTGALPLDEVRRFVRTAQVLLGSRAADRVHLVTTGTITRASRELVESISETRILTYDELVREIFLPEPELQRWLENYEALPINKNYLEIRATLHDAGQGKAEAPGRLPSSELLDVALRHPDAALVLLADYGSGKTTALERIKAKAIDRRMADPSSPVPVLIRLRDIRATSNAELIALDAIRTELGLRLEASTLWSFLEAGRLLMLLDGFDEITLKTNDRTRAQLLMTLSPLLFNRSPAILTSRPSYFASMAEYQAAIVAAQGGLAKPAAGAGSDLPTRIHGFAAELSDRYVDSGPADARRAHVLTYQLDALNSDQIDQFLTNAEPDFVAVGTSAQDVRAFLDQIYDLADLITRPILLDMAVVSVLSGQIVPQNGTLANGPAGLYEAYAHVQLDRDWRNLESRRSTLSFETRMKFAEECAMEMSSAGTLKLEQTEVRRLAKRAEQSPGERDIEELLTDLRTCSFLTIDDEGSLRFIHRSFQEFFLARHIWQSLRSRSTAGFRDHLPWECLYFLGAFAFTDDDFYEILNEYARQRGATEGVPAATADNAAQALLCARETARRLSWEGRTLKQVRRPNLAVRESSLSHVTIENLRADEMNFVDSDLTLTLRAERLRHLELEGCSGSVSLDGRIGECTFRSGSLVVVDESACATLRADAIDLDLTVKSGAPKSMELRSVAGRVNVASATFTAESCSLRLGVGESVQGSIDDSIVELSVEGFDNFAARASRSLIHVSGQRVVQSLGASGRAARRITQQSEPSESATVIVDPTVSVDGWWSLQHDLLTLGASTTTAGLDLTGVFFRRTKGDRASVATQETGPKTLVIEGRGRDFELAMEEFRSTVKLIRTSAGWSRWADEHFRAFVSERAPSSDLVERLMGDLLRRFESLSRTHAL